MTTPSEALAVAKLPVEIFDAYLGGVVDAITQRQSVQSATANLLTAQTQNLNAQTALQKASAAGSQSATTALQSGVATTIPAGLPDPAKFQSCRAAGYTVQACQSLAQ